MIYIIVIDINAANMAIINISRIDKWLVSI